MLRLRSGSFTLRSASLACSRLTSAKAAPLPAGTVGAASAGGELGSVDMMRYSMRDPWSITSARNLRNDVPQRRTPAFRRAFGAGGAHGVVLLTRLPAGLGLGRLRLGTPRPGVGARAGCGPCLGAPGPGYGLGPVPPHGAVRTERGGHAEHTAAEVRHRERRCVGQVGADVADHL